MKIAVVYIYPMVKTRIYFPLAKRFADTWRKFPPGLDHTLYVVCNGSDPSPNDTRVFNGIPAQFVRHTNLGWDIGAYQWAAEAIECDLMVCLGAPVHFHRERWLERMAESFIENGPGLYGCWAYLNPNWHVRTTVFWFPPELLKSYPYVIGNSRKSRYEFEHGNRSFTRHALSAGFPCIMVTWSGFYPFSEWTIYGPDYKESLVHDQFTNSKDQRLRDRVQ